MRKCEQRSLKLPYLKLAVFDVQSPLMNQYELTFSYLIESDLPDIIAMLAKESVCEHVFFGPDTEQDTRAYFEPLVESIQAALAKGEPPAEHVFSIRKDGAFLGQCALLPVACGRQLKSAARGNRKVQRERW